MKTSELIGPALDWAVAKCEGVTSFGAPEGRSEAMEFLLMHECDPDLRYSTDWAQGGPIIDRELIDVGPYLSGEDRWSAKKNEAYAKGPTPLIAAMRCFCASKLGDEVKLPEELK